MRNYTSVGTQALAFKHNPNRWHSSTTTNCWHSNTTRNRWHSTTTRAVGIQAQQRTVGIPAQQGTFRIQAQPEPLAFKHNNELILPKPINLTHYHLPITSHNRNTLSGMKRHMF